MNKQKKVIAIIGGGEPINDCPKDWDEAKGLESKWNTKNDPIKWSFDCGFKLDYDGPVIEITSRFYPPKTYYGKTWDGSLDVLILGDVWVTKEFNEPTREKLIKAVESYKKHIVGIINGKLR